MSLFGNVPLMGWFTDPTSGTVASVGLALPVSVFTISGSPVTGSGTLTGSFNTQAANTVFAGPASGIAATPTFRSLVAADISGITGVFVPYSGANATVDLNTQSLTSGTHTIAPAIVATGAAQTFVATGALNTNQTAGAEINNFAFVTTGRQWATGAIATQREIRISGPTYSFVGASTITDAFTVYAAAPIAGTNATITNAWVMGGNGSVYFTGTNNNFGNAAINTTGLGALRVGQGTATVDIGTLGAGFGTFWLGNTPTTNNYALASDGTTMLLNAPLVSSQLYLTKGNGSYFALFSGDTSSGNTPSVEYRNSARTSITAGANAPQYLYTYQQTYQFATGAIPTNYAYRVSTPTLTAVGASTITDAFNLYVFVPTAGTNVTITNNWGIGTNGAIQAVGGLGIGAVPSSTRPINVSSTVAGEYSMFITNVSSGVSAQASIRLGNNSNQSIIGQASSGATVGNGLYAYALNFRNDDYGYAFYQQGNGPASGALTRFRIWGPGATTNQTASTDIPSFINSSLSRQWATGAITLQRENHFQTATYSFVGASTIAEAHGMYVEAPTAGTNATFTNNFALGLLAGTATIKMGNLTGDATSSAIYMNAATPSTTNYFVNSDGSVVSVNGSTLRLKIANITAQNITGSAVSFTPGSTNTGAVTSFTFQPAGNTNQTLSTEIPGVNFALGTRQWATGTITTQREVLIGSVVYSFVGASTITSAYGLYVSAPTAGTNCSINANYAIFANGNMATNGVFYANAGLIDTTTATLQIQRGGTTFLTASATTMSFTPGAASSGSASPFSFTMPNSTGQTASTEVKGFTTVGGTIQHATGTLATQRDHFFAGRIHAFVGASTLTNLYTAYFELGAAGANATITNNWSAGFGGNIQIQGSVFFTVANSFTIATGTGQRAGNATLVGGTLTVTNTTVTANTVIIITRKTAGGTPGNTTYTLSAGASFTINSDSGTDTSTYSYLLFELV